jgi:CRP-like cAMP-binding protein
LRAPAPTAGACAMNSDENPLHFLLRKLELRWPLSDLDRSALLALPYRVRELEAQSYTVREGDRPERCAILLSGFAFRQKITGEGARQILAVHIPGDALDFQNLFFDESDHSVQMLTRGQVAEIPREALQELALGNSAIGRAILVVTLVDASISREWTLNIGRRDARSRIAHLLCEFACRLEVQGLSSGDAGYELPMTQEQIADAAGLTPVHVNRVLKSLESEGLIERNRRFVRFPHWQQLRDVGDFSTRYLHVPHERLA